MGQDERGRRTYAVVGLEGETLLHEVLGMEIAANDPEEDDEDKEAKQ